jgi:Zn-dependent M32 family carboxypeptidase
MGGIHRSRNLIRSATGSDPDPHYLERYFEKKYGALYKLGR